MSGFPSILDTKIQNVLNEIGKIPESNGGQVGVGIDPEPGNKILESLTKPPINWRLSVTESEGSGAKRWAMCRSEILNFGKRVWPLWGSGV